MSRSRRHTPIGPLTVNDSNKAFKKQEHKRERSCVRRLLHVGCEEWELPHPKRYGNEWDSPRDGKQYFGDMNRPSYFEKWNHFPYNDLWTPDEIVASYNKYMRK